MRGIERLRPKDERQSEDEIIKEAEEDLFSPFEREDFLSSLCKLRGSVLESTKKDGLAPTFLFVDLSARPFVYAVKELFSDQKEKPNFGFFPIDRKMPEDVQNLDRDSVFPLFYLSVLSGDSEEKIEKAFLEYIHIFYSRDTESLNRLIDSGKQKKEDVDFFERSLKEMEDVRQRKITAAKTGFRFLYKRFVDQCSALQEKVSPSGRIIILDDIGHTGETGLIVAALCKNLSRQVEYHMLLSTKPFENMKWLYEARDLLPDTLKISCGEIDGRLVTFGGKRTTEISRSKAMKDYAFGVEKDGVKVPRTNRGDPFEKTLLREVMRRLGKKARKKD